MKLRTTYKIKLTYDTFIYYKIISNFKKRYQLVLKKASLIFYTFYVILNWRYLLTKFLGHSLYAKIVLHSTFYQ